MEWGIIWILCAPVAAIIGAKKGEFWSALIAGLVFGPLGILFAVLSRGNRLPCPYCKESIREDATICPHCRMTFTQQPESTQRDQPQ
jgi:hypothetical protein